MKKLQYSYLCVSIVHKLMGTVISGPYKCQLATHVIKSTSTKYLTLQHRSCYAVEAYSIVWSIIYGRVSSLAVKFRVDMLHQIKVTSNMIRIVCIQAC